MKKLYIAIASRNFFGAERRILRIVSDLRAGHKDYVDVALIVNSSFTVAARRTGWGTDFLDDMEAESRLLVVPDRLDHLRLARHPGRVVVALFGRTPIHAVLRAEPLVYVRALLGLPGSIELTGPGSAERRARRLPLFLLRRLTIRLLTPSVARKFHSALDERFGREVAAEIMNRTRTASTPYFNRQPEPVDVANKDRLVVSASRFAHRKNVVRIAQALAIALPRLPGWTAQVMGQGEDDAEIRHALESLAAESRVTVGYEPNVEEVFRRSRIYISLIEPDNYPSQAVMEAMHFGNALILSDNGDSGVFLGEPHNGELVSLDPQEVADRIVAMATDEKRLAQMGEASVARLHNVFDPQVHLAELLALHGIARPGR